MDEQELEHVGGRLRDADEVAEVAEGLLGEAPVRVGGAEVLHEVAAEEHQLLQPGAVLGDAVGVGEGGKAGLSSHRYCSFNGKLKY